MKLGTGPLQTQIFVRCTVSKSVNCSLFVSVRTHFQQTFIFTDDCDPDNETKLSIENDPETNMSLNTKSSEKTPVIIYRM